MTSLRYALRAAAGDCQRPVVLISRSGTKATGVLQGAPRAGSPAPAALGALLEPGARLLVLGDALRGRLLRVLQQPVDAGSHHAVDVALPAVAALVLGHLDRRAGLVERGLRGA